MQLHQHDHVDGRLADLGWSLYDTAFADLRTAAVQRHLMTRAEFDAVLADKRVTKYVGTSPATGAPIALATVTDDLTAVPLISPDYFAHRWPEHYAQRRIWYIGFVAVHPHHHGTGAFVRIVEEMCALVAARGGIAAIDICRRNEDVYGLPGAVSRLVDTFTDGVRTHRMDEQTYWAYEFPTA